MIRQIHAEASARGIDVLDAPVSGGPRGAASRNLAIWVGGDKEVFDRCKPVLDSIGDKAYYVGPIGCGAIAKLVHNCTGYIVQRRSGWRAALASSSLATGVVCGALFTNSVFSVTSRSMSMSA